MKQPPTSFDPRATREYRELGFEIVACPACGKEILDDYFICQKLCDFAVIPPGQTTAMEQDDGL